MVTYADIFEAYEAGNGEELARLIDQKENELTEQIKSRLTEEERR